MRTRWKRIRNCFECTHCSRWWVYGCARANERAFDDTQMTSKTKTIEQIKSDDGMRQRTWFVFAFLINATIKYRPWPWAGCQQLISAAREFQRKEKSGKCETMKPKPIRFSLVAFAVLLPCHHFDKVWNCAVRDLCEMKFHDLWTQHVTPAAAPTLSYRVLHFFAGPLVIVRIFFFIDLSKVFQRNWILLSVHCFESVGKHN